MTDGQKVFDDKAQIFAGKFRRYHKESWLKRLLDIRTNLLNIRDVVYVVLGIFESMLLLRRVRPDVVLLKGGFVGMPVGLAAAALKIPFVTHDSDALPGLANRVVARWAKYHATGMPASFYTYDPAAIRYVGVLVNEDYQEVTSSSQREFKKALGIPVDAKVLMVTGGSGGSAIINKAVKAMLPELKAEIPELFVIHQTGQGKEYSLKGSEDWLVVHDLLQGMHRYSGAADVIISRAGANTIAEFGVQHKACIVVPNPMLTGGHQLINARELEKNDAVIIVQEASLDQLLPTTVDLLRNEAKRNALAKTLGGLTKPHAADELAEILLSVVKEGGEKA